MAGILYLGCGSAEDEQPLWRAMLHRARTRIVYWPFALPPDMIDSADAWLRGNLDRLGLGYSLQTWPRLAEHRPGELGPESVDLLFVGGGNTFRLLDAVRAADFLPQVRRFVAAGGDYYGGSAGAVLACDTIAIAEGHDLNDAGLTDLSALGLIHDVSILPHFTDDQIESAQGWAAQRQSVVFGLPETVGLRCSAERAEIIGRGVLTRIDATSVRDYPAGHQLEIG